MFLSFLGVISAFVRVPVSVPLCSTAFERFLPSLGRSDCSSRAAKKKETKKTNSLREGREAERVQGR